MVSGKTAIESGSGIRPAGGNDSGSKPGLVPVCPQRTSLGFILLLLAVAVIVAWAHWPALSARAMSFDDSEYIDDSCLIRNPSWMSTRRLITEVLEPSTIRGYYHPLAMISLMLDVARGGGMDHPEAFHRTNLLLHVMNTGLVIVLVYLCFGQAWPAAVAGLLFGLHPLTVEPVVWIAARKALLAGTFALWSLVLYVGYARYGKRPLYGASLIAYVLALMSKPTSIPLPVLMIILDCWPLARFGRKRLVEKIPFFAVGAFSAIIACVSHARTAILALPPGESIMQAPLLVSYKLAFLVGKVFWPAHLSCYYEVPKPLTLSNPVVLASVAGVLVGAACLAIWARRLPVLAAGSLFFLAAAGPMLGLFRYGETWVFAFDNYLYLPMVGPLLMIASAFAWICSRRPSRNWLAPGTWAALAVVVILCGSELAATRRYLVRWRHSEALARYMLTLAPDAAVLHNHLAVTLEGEGQVQEAVRHYWEALRLKPDYPEVHNNLAVVLADQGRPDEAVQHYAEALRIRPDYAEAHNNLGFALLGQSRIDESIAHCRRALELKPEYADAHNNLGLALAAQDHLDQAISHYRRALELKPDHMKAQNNLAVALLQQGHLDQAVSAFRRAVELKPDSAEAHNNLGLALREQGQMAEAIDHLREALRRKPDYLDAHVNMAMALAAVGRLEEGIEQYRQALRIQPLDADLHCSLGELLERRGRIGEAATEYREVLRINPQQGTARVRLAALSPVSPTPTTPAR